MILIVFSHQSLGRVDFAQDKIRRIPCPVPSRSKAWVCGRTLVGIAISNPTGCIDACLFLSVVCVCVFCPCVGLITRPEESYWMWCSWVWSRNLIDEDVLGPLGLSSHNKNKLRRSMHRQPRLCCAVYLMLFSATCFMTCGCYDYTHIWRNYTLEARLNADDSPSFILEAHHSTFYNLFVRFTKYMICFYGAPGGAVGRGTALQAGRSRVRFPMVSLTSFRPHYGPGVDSASNRNEYQ